MLATNYAEYYKIDPQGEGESNMAFKGRVAGALRDQGRIIEAHEAQQDERYESSDSVMAGVFGAVGQAMQGVDYHSDGERQVGDNIAAGTILRSERPTFTAEMAMLMIQLGL